MTKDTETVMREALESIRQYGSDTLAGPVYGPDDRDWHCIAVVEMTRRASAALAAAPIEPQPMTNLVTDALEGYRAGLNGEPMGFRSEAFDCGWISGDHERRTTSVELPQHNFATALAVPGAERLRDWVGIGPAQRAALETFIDALAPTTSGGNPSVRLKG